MADDRASISAIVLNAMGDAWTDSEEHSELPGIAADLLLTSEWLAAHDEQVGAEAYDLGVFDGACNAETVRAAHGLRSLRAEGERAAAERIAALIWGEMNNEEMKPETPSSTGRWDGLNAAYRIARGEAERE